MSTESEGVANRVNIVATRRNLRKGLPWIPDIDRLAVCTGFPVRADFGEIPRVQLAPKRGQGSEWTSGSGSMS